jgi:acetyl esterase/lipase
MIITWVGCHSGETKKALTETVPEELKSVRVTDNIPYRSGHEKWVLDLAEPENFGEEIRPAIVLVHGGGWRFGSKQEPVFRSMLLYYANLGYVTVSVDYRLADDAPFPACIEDVKCAVRWLRAHAEEYRIDPERIGTYGHSAGAHLAVMLAVSSENKELEGDGPWQEYSSRLTCAAGGATPTEIGNPNNPWSEHPEWGPIGYISGGQPPILLLQGGADPIVKAHLVEDYYNKMKAAGANIEYIVVSGQGHDVSYSLATDITQPAMDQFFAEYLKK